MGYIVCVLARIYVLRRERSVIAYIVASTVAHDAASLASKIRRDGRRSALIEYVRCASMQAGRRWRWSVFSLRGVGGRRGCARDDNIAPRATLARWRSAGATESSSIRRLSCRRRIRHPFRWANVRFFFLFRFSSTFFFYKRLISAYDFSSMECRFSGAFIRVAFE